MTEPNDVKKKTHMKFRPLLFSLALFPLEPPPFLLPALEERGDAMWRMGCVAEFWGLGSWGALATIT